MEGKYLKIIFTIIVIVLAIGAIYITLIKDNKNEITPEHIATTNNEKIISNDIRIGIIEFDNINPILSNNKNVQDISRLIFEPLFTLTEEYKISPALAKEYSKLDKNTYIIKLREDVRWQDGAKFNSSDVIFTIDMLKKLGDSSVYYYNVKDISQIEQIDEYTLKIITESEIEHFEYNLIFPIISGKYFSEENLKLESKNIKPVGTGMFYISNVDEKSILLKKSTNEWNSKQMKIDSITLKLYNTLTDAINAFKSGEIDLFTTSNKNIEEYLKNINYNKVEYINRNYGYIALNCKNNVLYNNEVRQAINMAIDKEEIIKDVYNNKYMISNFPLDFGSYVYNTNNTFVKLDRNEAKKILTDNGWKYSNKTWTKTVAYRYLRIDLDLIANKKDSNMVKTANKIKDQLKEIGIKINVIEASESQYNNYLKNKNYDMILINSTYGYSPSLNKYFGNDNISNYENEEISNLLNEVENITDENEIKQKYSRINELYNNEVPYISLYFNKNTMLYSSNLKGNFKPNSYNLFYNIESWYREYKK